MKTLEFERTNSPTTRIIMVRESMMTLMIYALVSLAMMSSHLVAFVLQFARIGL